MNVRLIGVGIAVAGLILMAACATRDSIGGDRRECPHDWTWDTLHVEEGQPVVPTGQLSVPGIIQNVPEFHDCQRFWVEDSSEPTGLRFDSLFAIFAPLRAERLDTLLWLDTLVRVQRPDAPAAQIVDRAELQALSDLTGDEGLAAAEIYAEHSYEPLGIGLHFSCLYLYRRDGAWGATMVQYDSEEKDCNEPVDPETLGDVMGMDKVKRLEVVPHTVPGMGASDYPPVARWDWDDDNQRHYIGIRCGPAWCEVGESGFQTSALFEADVTGIMASDVHNYQVKGWYDQQYLAGLQQPGQPPVPTRIKGTILPHENLASYNDPSDFALTAPEDDWPPAAYVALNLPQGTANPYKLKFGFDLTVPGARLGQLNTISLCYGERGECFDANATNVPNCTGEAGDKPWWARIRGTVPNEAPRHFCIVRCNLADLNLTIPATVRWRWLATDDGAWMRCAQGCCELHGDDDSPFP